MTRKINNIFQISNEDNLFFYSALNVFGISQEGYIRRFKYRTTNHNLFYLKSEMLRLHKKKILAISGSGLQLFDLLTGINGTPQSIIGFDLSPKQVAYNYFVKYAFKYLEYSEFLSFFGFHAPYKATQKNKVFRTHLFQCIPKKLRIFLPRRHHLTNRDRFLIYSNHYSFLLNECYFNRIKKHISKIHFLIFNFNPLEKKYLSNFFDKNSFDFIYLSNALDWLCWHYHISQLKLLDCFKDMMDVSSPNAHIVLEQLRKRPTMIRDILSRIDGSHINSYTAYTYYWDIYHFKLKKLREVYGI